MKRLARGRQSSEIPRDEAGTHADQDRDPRRALDRICGRAAAPSAGGCASPWAGTDEGAAGGGGLEVLPELDAFEFLWGVKDLEHRNGAEHHARFDPATNRVIKLTMPGEFGAWGGLMEYLQRMAWVNELFDDDVQIEGWLRYPNENGPRLVTSQPWYKVSPERPEPTPAEIDAYMWRKGFVKCYDGAWVHARRDIAASDALPKNFVVDVAGHVQPFDVILLAPDQAHLDHLRNLARDLPQADVTI